LGGGESILSKPPSNFLTTFFKKCIQSYSNATCILATRDMQGIILLFQ